MACPSVVLQNQISDTPSGSVTIDGETPDTNGNLWTLSSLQGWWDTTDLRVERQEVGGRGETITVTKELGRAIVLEALVTSPTPNSVPLGELLWASTEIAKAAGRCLYSPGLIFVTDPTNTLHSHVWRVGPIKSAIIGPLAAVQIQWQLLAPDPMRYDVDLNPFD